MTTCSLGNASAVAISCMTGLRLRHLAPGMFPGVTVFFLSILSQELRLAIRTLQTLALNPIFLETPFQSCKRFSGVPACRAAVKLFRQAGGQQLSWQHQCLNKLTWKLKRAHTIKSTVTLRGAFARFDFSLADGAVNRWKHHLAVLHMGTSR